MSQQKSSNKFLVYEKSKWRDESRATKTIIHYFYISNLAMLEV